MPRYELVGLLFLKNRGNSAFRGTFVESGLRSAVFEQSWETPHSEDISRILVLMANTLRLDSTNVFRIVTVFMNFQKQQVYKLVARHSVPRYELVDLLFFNRLKH